MAATKCRWCSRLHTPDGTGFCSPACRKTRNRLMRRYPEEKEHSAHFGVDWEGFIHFAGGFFDDLRLGLAACDPDALAFVMGRAGQYAEWCDLLEVPDRDALTSHLMAQWGKPYLQRHEYVAGPKPPEPVSGKLVPKCANPDCGKEGVENFNRRGHGYRSLCKECESVYLREYRERRKEKLQERATA